MQTIACSDVERLSFGGDDLVGAHACLPLELLDFGHRFEQRIRAQLRIHLFEMCIRDRTTPGETLASDANGLVTLTAPQIRNLTECGTAISVGGYQVGEKHADLPTMPELTIPSGSAHTPTPEKLEFPQESCSQATAGARMIVDAARAFGPDLTILVTGPLTDIDTALTLDPEAVRQARIVFMGGTLTQEGNCYDLVCETNMIQDPEAADRVLRSGADVTMVGLDVTHRCLLGSSDITPWNAAHTEASRFLTAIAEFSIRANAASEPIFAAGMRCV